MKSSAKRVIEIFRKSAQPVAPIPTGIDPCLPKLPNIKAVLFDIYGTLFQSAVGDISLVDSNAGEARENALRAILETSGMSLSADLKFSLAERLQEIILKHQESSRQSGIAYPEVDILEVWQVLLEPLVRDGLITIPDPDCLESSLMEVAARFEAAVNPVFPMPSAEGILDWLKARQLVVGVVSNAQSFTPLLFDACFGRSMEDLHIDLDLRVYSFEHKQAKPGTFLYELCAKQLKSLHSIEPEDTLYIGNDQRNDVWPASLCGFKTALFAGDQRSYRPRTDHPEAPRYPPDGVLTHLSQLKDILG